MMTFKLCMRIYARGPNVLLYKSVSTLKSCVTFALNCHLDLMCQLMILVFCRPSFSSEMMYLLVSVSLMHEIED